MPKFVRTQPVKCRKGFPFEKKIDGSRGSARSAKCLRQRRTRDHYIRAVGLAKISAFRMRLQLQLANPLGGQFIWMNVHRKTITPTAKSRSCYAPFQNRALTDLMRWGAYAPDFSMPCASWFSKAFQTRSAPNEWSGLASIRGAFPCGDNSITKTYFTVILLPVWSSVPRTRTRLPSNLATSG